MIRFITCFLAALLCAAPALNAQKPRSSLVVRMDDGQPLTVAVNNRYFNKTGTRLTVGDVLGKRPYLQVYRFRPYADGKGGKAELVFSGKIKIERRGTYEVIVHPGNRSVSVGQRRILPQEQPLSPGAYEQEQIITLSKPAGEAEKAPWLQTLLNQMADKVKDSDKLRIARSGLPPSLTTIEAGFICDAILFEDNKLHFLKEVHSKIADPENFSHLKDRLGEAGSRDELERWLQSQE